MSGPFIAAVAIMKENPYQLFMEAEEDSVDLKEVLLKYARFWPWFLAGLLLCGMIANLYLRYTPNTYYSEAKIKVLQEEESLNLGETSLLGGANINLQNEIQILKSYRLAREVVQALHLDVDYYVVGDLKTTQTWDPPFVVERLPNKDASQTTGNYDI